MAKLLCFQMLLFLTITINVNTLQTIKQHILTQYFGKDNDEKYFSSAAGNPYILACNSSSQCQDTVLDECVMAFPAQDTWYCNCFCDGYGPCKTNRDCCNNNCVNELCTNNGGEQGTVCSGSCSTCATDYECRLLPDDGGMGYCDYSGVHTTSSIPATTTSYTGSNPWIYIGCPNGQIQCQGTIRDSCNEEVPSNTTTWYCLGECNGQLCKINKDCYNNECINGICSSSGGLEGTFCFTYGESCTYCSQGLTCHLVYSADGYGYCG